MFKDSLYSQFIYVSRYSRYLEKENRREVWPETVKRYFDFIESSISEKHNYDIKPYREELEQAVLSHEIMPSMRALMTAGPAAKKNEIGIYNCLGGETLVTTKEYGIIPIKELVGKSVHVVDGNGEWCLSKCNFYGEQDLYKINLVTSGIGKFSINATSNHRWFDRSGKEIITKNLIGGTLLANVSLPNRIEADENSEDYKKGIIHGIIYGDGTAIYKNGYGGSSKNIYSERICSGFAIRLCGRSKELLRFFDEYPKSFPKSYNGDPVIYMKNATVDLKDLPNNDEFFTDNYMIGFIRGWLAADGCVGKTVPQVTLASTLEGMEWIYKYGPRYGFSILHNRKFSNETNLGTRKKDLFNIEFDRRYLIPNDFILEYKRVLFKKVNKSIGKVLSVEFYGKENVYCFDVPTTHSFMLTKNILTGNCVFLPIDNLKAFDEEMVILMSGTGVGFSVENEFVKQIPPLPDEFFQSETTIVFDDSRIGWGKGYREFLSILMTGQIPRWDVSKLRPAGARLKTMGGRCLSGDTIVYKDRKKEKGINEITISKLFDLQNNFPHRFEQIKLRSLDEETGEFFRNKVKSVIYNGKRKVYNLVTKNGYRIKATENHRFMNELGEYQFLSNFDVGDFIAVNGSIERKTGICLDCGKNISRRSIRCFECNRISQLKNDCLDTTSRQRQEVIRYKAKRNFCEICGIENIEFECHHKDGNPWNNNENNLQNLCISCHREEDMKRIYFGDAYSCKYMMYDEIIEISEASEEDVYDLEMEGPNHNFIANGFISHNSSGPEPLVDLLKFTINIFKRAAGRQLTSLECHDIACKIADIVICGGVRRCCKNTTRIQTTNGFKTIENINVGDFIVNGGKSYPVLEKVYSGKQKTLKIKHKFGVVDGVTENHVVAVFDDMNNYSFKKAAELNIGDVLVWDSLGIEGEKQKLPYSIENKHFNSRKIIFPEYLTEELAWIVGLVQGDGYVGARSIEIAGNLNDIEMLNYAKNLFKNIFGISSDVVIDGKKGNGIRLRINSKELSDWFRNNIKTSKENIQIPKFIFGAEKTVRYSYLMGLFDADGRITVDGGIDQCTTIYESLKDDLVTLLSGLGIGTKIFFKNNDKRRAKGIKCKDYYTIRIVGKLNREKWNEGLVFSKSIKNKNIKEYIGKNNDFSWPKSFFKKNGYRGDMSLLTSIELGLTNSNIFYPSKIEEIIICDEVDTYDIEVDTAKQFTIDGIVVHNSALISLSDLNDDRMRDAKSGNWWQSQPHRRLSNNSAVYEEKPDVGVFMKEWLSLYESKSGERGIISRKAMKNVIQNSNEYRYMLNKEYRTREINHKFGSNPCCEIILMPYEFCNLTSVQIYEDDTPETLKRKIRLATILGTFQSCFTDFKYINKKFQKNCENERLLGVSLNGIYDNKYTNGTSYQYDNMSFQDFLQNLKAEAIITNDKIAKEIGIPQSVAITCVKPEGTTSAFNGTSSGIHPAHSPYYIRYVRNSMKDPLSAFMVNKGFPFEIDAYDPNQICFKFPIKTSKDAIYKKDVGAVDHLKLWLKYQMYFTEHKPSVTISVKESEWLQVGSWCYDNFEWLSGCAFLPADEGSTVYKQMPFTECTEEEYNELLSKMPENIDWTQLNEFELENSTTNSQELSCLAGGCEI